MNDAARVTLRVRIRAELPQRQVGIFDAGLLGELPASSFGETLAWTDKTAGQREHATVRLGTATDEKHVQPHVSHAEYDPVSRRVRTDPRPGQSFPREQVDEAARLEHGAVWHRYRQILWPFGVEDRQAALQDPAKFQVRRWADVTVRRDYVDHVRREDLIERSRLDMVVR